MDSQATPGANSALNLILSSSLLLAVITGMLYFVGGVYYEAYSYSLGLTYLAGLQPAEYIFSGAQALGVSWDISIPFILISGAILFWAIKSSEPKSKCSAPKKSHKSKLSARLANALQGKKAHYSQNRELYLLVEMAIFAILLLVFAIICRNSHADRDEV